MSALKEEAAARYPVLTAEGRDYTAWARRLVYRHQQRDPDLLHVQIQYAYEALNIEQPKN